jgi:stage V sporulation protein D (sporulation-specific penicillin-binding protein)
MREILARVVTDGTGAPAKSKLFELCGKTGTAQVPSPAGGYYPNRYNASFIGFAPKDDPKVVIVITARDPRPIHFGGTVAGPAFRRIAERSLEYLATSGRRLPPSDI